MAYRAPALRGLAITQMVFGAFMITFGAACLFSVKHWSSYSGFGIWIGTWVLITGILGFIGARDNRKPNKCLTGCFMGFSITGCVLAGSMFICYCIAISEFSRTIGHCSNPDDDRYWYSYDSYLCTRSEKKTAIIGAGLGSCQLLFSIMVFFVALASSIYCCMALCHGTSSGQVNALQMYPGRQAGEVVVQPNGAMATVPPGYMVAGQQGIFMHPQCVPGQQPAPYWVMMPSGSNAPGTVTMSSVGAAGGGATQALQSSPQEVKEQELPPPYVYSTQTGNAGP